MSVLIASRLLLVQSGFAPPPGTYYIRYALNNLQLISVNIIVLIRIRHSADML